MFGTGYLYLLVPLGFFLLGLIAVHSPALLASTLFSTVYGFRRRIRSRRPPPPKARVAFFHPFTNDGGGGERVLWCMLKALQEEVGADQSASVEWVVYTGDEASSESLKERAKSIFGIHLQADIEVVRLNFRAFVEAATWPYVTLLGQSLGSIVLAAEAIYKCPPTLFIDTAGYAFSYPVAKFLVGSSVACYTHYPTISTDMLQRVKDRASLYNNSTAVARSPVLSSLKLLYYRGFAALYGLAGSYADVVMVNSSWTEAHIRSLWTRCRPTSIHRVYPPCDTSALQKLSLDRSPSAERYIISVAQFRPEKNHALQLRAFALALEQARKSESALSEQASRTSDNRRGSSDAPPGSTQSTQSTPQSTPESKGWLQSARSLLSFGRGSPQGSLQGEERATKALLDGVRLKLVGGARDKKDEARIELLSSLAAQLGIDGRVDFCVNVPFSELQSMLGQASCGIHTMLDEHFGISIVEYMASGAIAIAHNSGGPRADILAPTEEADGKMLPVGFLATTEEEYASAILSVFGMLPEERLAMASRARHRAASYSEESFSQQVKSILRSSLPA